MTSSILKSTKQETERVREMTEAQRREIYKVDKAVSLIKYQKIYAYTALHVYTRSLLNNGTL